MSSAITREKTARWLPLAIGGVLALVGIFYAKETGLWNKIFNSTKQSYRTVNTGASVQVGSVSGNRVPAVGASPRPAAASDRPPIEETTPLTKRRMW